jgi:hypothetical protein
MQLLLLELLFLVRQYYIVITLEQPCLPQIQFPMSAQSILRLITILSGNILQQRLWMFVSYQVRTNLIANILTKPLDSQRFSFSLNLNSFVSTLYSDKSNTNINKLTFVFYDLPWQNNLSWRSFEIILSKYIAIFGIDILQVFSLKRNPLKFCRFFLFCLL